MSILENLIERKNLHVILLFVFGFLLYANTIPHDYAQDDAIVITENMYTQKGISGIPSILSKDAFYGFFKEEGKAFLVQGGRYRPLSIITFAIEQSIFGGNPHISHAINALLYGFIGIFMYWVFAGLIHKVKDEKSAILIGFVATLLYLFHPLHTEVVANIKGRDEIFVVLFGLISMYFFFVKKKSFINIFIACLSFGAALLSKENAVVWVVIFPLTMYFFNKEIRLKDGIALLPFFALTIGFLVLRGMVLEPGISSVSQELMNNPFLKFDGTKMIDLDFSEKWGTVVLGLGKYLQLLIWPFNQTSDYYPYQIPISTLTSPLVLLSLVVHLALLILMFLGFLKKKIYAYGLLIYFGALFLVSNIPFSIGTNISERFLFFPTVGICLSIGCLLVRFLQKKENVLFSIIALICIIFGTQTILRNKVWKDDFTLLTKDVLRSNNSAKAYNGASGALSEKASTIQDKKLKKELARQSLEYAQKATELYPLYSNAYLIQGNNYFYLELYDEAIKSYEKVLSLEPENQDAIQNLSIVLREAGKYYGQKKGDLKKSLSLLKQAYVLNATDYETLRLLGTANAFSGDVQNALKYFQEAKNLKPELAGAWVNLGKAFGQLGDLEKAQQHFIKAKQLDPNVKI